MSAPRLYRVPARWFYELAGKGSPDATGTARIQHGDGSSYHIEDTLPERARELNRSQGIEPAELRAALVCCCADAWHLFDTIRNHYRRHQPDATD